MTSQKSTWSASNSPTANSWTKNRARSPSKARRESMKWPGSAAWAEKHRHDERSGTRPLDADAHRRRHSDGLPHGVYADGPRHVLRLHRLLRPVAELDPQQGVRADGPAHL